MCFLPNHNVPFVCCMMCNMKFCCHCYIQKSVGFNDDVEYSIDILSYLRNGQINSNNNRHRRVNICQMHMQSQLNLKRW